jgi:PhnB protein
MSSEQPSKKRPSPVPEEASATPYLCVRDGVGALAFYAKAFGAVESMRIPMPDGKLGHAEFRIGKAKLMISDEFPSMNVLSPQTLGGSATAVHVYVEDVDAFAERAQREGAKLLRPVIDEFYGERIASLEDPYGHRWSFASRIEELTDDEIMQRAKQGAG